jgi:hypothetical protein
MKNQHPSVLAMAAVSIIAVAFAALLEVAGALCASGLLFAGYGLFWTLVLLPFLIRRPSGLKFIIHGLLVLSLLILYLVPWNSRKPFLRDLDRVTVGMTVSEVETIMGGYMKGTGWPANPFTKSGSSTGQLTEIGSGITMTTSNSPSGELMIQDSITYRHSDDGAFNSDWGVEKSGKGCQG